MEWQVPKIWSGDCFIIGGGSSIATEFDVPNDIVPEKREEFLEFGTYLSVLKDKHVIGVNLAAFLGDWVDVAYWGDTDTYTQYKAWFDAFSGLKVSSAGKFGSPKFTSIKHLFKTSDYGISPNPDELSWVGKNSGASAINLAYHLGCTRIMLLGFDMKSHPTGRIHWHTGYPDKQHVITNKDLNAGRTWIPREPNPKENYKRHLKGFPEVAADAEKLGIEIINLCPDSEVEQFPKMSVKEFFGIDKERSKNEAVSVRTSNRFCFCGGVLYKYKGALLSNEKIASLNLLECNKCGIVKQEVSDEELKGFYEEKYHTGIYKHTYDEDYKAAKLRSEMYEIYSLNAKGFSLDVGAGNGAFRDYCIHRGITCFSMDIGYDADYTKPLDENNFPTDYFSNVFLHDVLEHVTNPKAFLKTCFRILKQKGKCVVEVPDFFSEDGKKHWKPIEHIWMFNESNLISLLEEVGFDINAFYSPIPGKRVFICEKPKQNRVKILVPPGIGDIYWVLVKLQSFLKKKGIIDVPDVYIASMDEKKDRSLEYLKMFPFVNAAGYKKVTRSTIPWREAYTETNQSIFENVAGCDYFISFNGQLRTPRLLDAILPQYICNYDLPMFESVKERDYGESFLQENGDYIVAYFVDHGMYKSHWTSNLSSHNIVEILSQLADKFNCKIVLIGSKWDCDCTVNLLAESTFPKDKLVNLVGETDVEQVFGVIKRAFGVIGFPSGMTIMSTVFYVPTYIFWSDYFIEKFRVSSCHPGTNGITYKHCDVKEATVGKVVSEFKSIIHNGGVEKSNYVVCVLRSGGDYTAEYVQILKAMVSKNLTIPFEFRCLTDMDNLDLPDHEIIKLKHNWPGWWAKLEIFRKDLFPNGNVVYFDLDTVIVRNIDSIFFTDDDFRMLEGFGKTKPLASGIMGFQTDLSWIYNKLVLSEREIYTENRKLRWDQRFISKNYIDSKGFKPGLIQSDIKVASYKNTILNDKKNVCDFDVICFHGKPRPHECSDKQITKYWKV